MIRRLTSLTLSLLALLLPFELEQPWLRLGPLVLTNVELVLWAALALALLCWWQDGRPRLPIPRSWLATGLCFVGALFLSAFLAPDFRANAVKAALRTASGMALALAVVALGARRRVGRARAPLVGLATAVVGGGLVAAVLGMAEIADGAGFEWLAAFRTAPTVAGPFLRLSGPFDYANQAAMYFEATLPLLLALVWAAWQGGRRLLVVLGIAASVLYVEATIFTFSRTSFVTLLFILGAVAFVRRQQHDLPARRRLHAPQVPFAGGAALVLLLIGANILLNPIFRLRFQSETDTDWYLARFEVPAELSLPAGTERLLTVTVTNESILTWRSTGEAPINVAARWLQAQGGRELATRPRWPLTRPVPPGESLTMRLPLRAPREPGQYRLVWDMVQEQVAWFGAKTGREAYSMVTVTGRAPAQAGTGGNAGNAETFEAAWNYRAPIPGRLTLWRAAADLWQTRPLLGIGLDNFRLLYGRSLGYESWNTTIHSNNWYIETFVSLGLLGSAPFFLLLGLLLWDIWRGLRRPEATVWHAAAAAGLLAFLVHGLLDYFLLFNATGLLFWLLLGFWLLGRQTLTREQQG